MEKLLTKEQVCRLLAISDSTLDRIVSDGSLAAIRIRGRLRFTETDLEAYLQRSRIEASAPPSPIYREAKTPAARRRMATVKPTQIRACEYVPGMKVV